MLTVYKDMADNNICQAEQMLTDAMNLREAANMALDRAANIAEALARFIDADSLGKDHAEDEVPVSGPRAGGSGVVEG